MQQASELISKGQLRTALAECNEVIRRNSRSAAAVALRGVAWFKLRELDKAMSDFDKAICYDGTCALAYQHRQSLFVSRGDLDKAMSDIDCALRLDPSWVEGYCARGSLWHKKGRFKYAIENFTSAIELSPHDAVAYHDRGRARYELGDVEEAIADYEESLRLSPISKDTASTRMWSGCARAFIGDNDRARKDADEAIRLDPTLVDAYVLRATMNASDGRTDDAINDYLQILQLQPRNLQALNGLAWILATHADVRFRDPKRAFEKAHLACETTRWKEEEFIITLAAAVASAGRFKEAMLCLTLAAEISPNNYHDLREAMKADFENGFPYREQRTSGGSHAE